MSLAGAGVSLAAAVVSAFFTVMVLRKALVGRKWHNVMWSVGLLMFTLVAAIQVVAETSGWTDGLYKAWYVFGTSLVGFLGAGSVYIVHKRMGHAFAAYIAILFVAFVFMAIGTATDPAGLAAFTAGAPPSGTGWIAGATVRRMSPLFTVPGSLTLIGIAAWGLYRYRLMYNGWIAAGALVLAVGTGLERFGQSSLIYGAEFVGIALMFVGFRQAAEWAKARSKAAPTALRPVHEEEMPQPVVTTAPK